MSSPANALLADGLGVGTILDDDGAPTVSIGDMTVNESAGTITFEITRTGSAAGEQRAGGSDRYLRQQRAQVQPGESLLVLGAAGGVGLSAVHRDSVGVRTRLEEIGEQ